MHTNAEGEVVTHIPGGAGAEFDFIMSTFEKKFEAAGANLKTQCVWLEILVAVDELGDEDACWEAVEQVGLVKYCYSSTVCLVFHGVVPGMQTIAAFQQYFDDDCRPAGVIYPGEWPCRFAWFSSCTH